MRLTSRSIERLATPIVNGALNLASFGLVLMTLIICWQVFSRYLINASVVWSESLALLIMLAFVMLAAAAGVYQQFHLGIRLVVSKMGPKWGSSVYIVGQSLIAFFGLVMLWSGFLLIDYTHSHIIPTLGLSRSVGYWPFVICGALITLFALARCLIVILDRGAKDPWN